MNNKKIAYNKYELDISWISEKGERPVNEDSVCVAENEKVIMCAVADGLGAHGGGDVASLTALESAIESCVKYKRLSYGKLIKIFDEMNKSVVSKQTDEVSMKTTFAGIFFSGRKIYLSNIGDTRFYIFDDGELKCMSVDHSLSYEMVMSQGGTVNDIRNHPQRHILTSAIGVEYLRKPDIYMNKIKETQAYLICSDGFWEYVCEDEMILKLKDTVSSDDWLNQMLKIHNENAAKWHDNYSALCVRINKK